MMYGERGERRVSLSGAPVMCTPRITADQIYRVSADS